MALTSDIRDNDQIRIYDRADSVVFLKTKEAFGGLSNMAGGFPLCVNGIHIRTSEALYQACRFPHLPEVQRLIIEQRSPMTAKMKSRKHHQDSRTDWDWVRVKIMRWCLRVKLIQNWNAFSELLIETGDQSIVEQSRKDDFWGAKPIDTPTLVGVNALGRLLMELREEVKTEGQEAFLQIEPLDISDFSLGGRPIEPVTAPDLSVVTSEPLSYPLQPLLFEPSVVKEPAPPDYVAEIAKNTGIANFEPHTAYKDSGVEWIGEIPAHWEVRRIKTLFREKDERSGDGKGELLSLTRLNGLIPQKKASSRIPSVEDLSKYKICRPGDLVMNRMQAWSGMFAVPSQEGLISPDYCVFELTNSFEVKYFEHLFKTPLLVGQFAQRSKGIGSGFNRLYTPEFGQVLTLLPPKSEQKRIVLCLDQKTVEIDEAIDKNQRLIELLKELKQTTIAETVTKGLNPNVPMRDSGVEWLGEVPAHWEMRRLKFCVQLTDQKMKADREKSLPYVGLENIQSWTGKLLPLGPNVVPTGVANHFKKKMTLFGKLRPYLAKAFNPDFEGLCSTELLVFKSITFDRRLLLYLLLTDGFIKAIDSSTYGAKMPRANWDFIGNSIVPVPPLEEQKKIASFLDQTSADIDEAIDKKQRLIELLKELKPITIAEAVTGKIKV